MAKRFSLRESVVIAFARAWRTESNEWQTLAQINKARLEIQGTPEHYPSGSGACNVMLAQLTSEGHLEQRRIDNNSATQWRLVVDQKEN